jgi:hypothetical protein
MTKECEKSSQRRLAGDLTDTQELAQHWIRPQPTNVRESLRPAQNPSDKAQGDLRRGLRRTSSSSRLDLGFPRRQYPSALSPPLSTVQAGQNTSDVYTLIAAAALNRGLRTHDYLLDMIEINGGKCAPDVACRISLRDKNDCVDILERIIGDPKFDPDG